MSDDNLKILIESLINAIEAQAKSLETHIEQLEEVKMLLQRQNFYTLPAGGIMTTTSCDTIHKARDKKIDDKLSDFTTKIIASWVVITFILLGYGAVIGWLVDIVHKFITK